MGCVQSHCVAEQSGSNYTYPLSQACDLRGRRGRLERLLLRNRLVGRTAPLVGVAMFPGCDARLRTAQRTLRDR